MKKLLVLALIVAAAPLSARALSGADYAKRPKLVLVLVVDQLRGDFLTRYENRLVPAGSPAKPGGFRFLTHHGAWFPFAKYEVLQAMTCPSHATILSGAWYASHGIGTNEWFDPSTKKVTYCADDADGGPSPRRMRASTVGDELKLVKPKSRVIAIAGKDRSAIMLGGHAADRAFWLSKKPRWETSAYYGANPPPAWVETANKAMSAKTPDDFDFMKPNGARNSTKATLDLALAALKGEKLGRGPETDLLAVSLSDHDALGHFFGPSSKEVDAHMIFEDRAIAEFLRGVKAEMGSLNDVVIALTADHGVPPTVETAKAAKIDSGRFDFLALTKKINARLDAKFGAPGKKEWLLGGRLLHFFLNPEALADRDAKKADVEAEAKKVLLEEPGVLDVFTRSEFDRGLFPPGPTGQQLRNSYIPGQSGDIVIVAKPFFYLKGSVIATHMTGWGYDRSVPMVLYGRAFKPGVYANGEVVDLAPTLAFVLGIVPPAMSQGRVLGEALR